MTAAKTVRIDNIAKSGIDKAKLDILRTRARKEVEEGLLPSVQFAVARSGEIVWSEAIGAAGIETLYPIFSCTKAVLASAAWLLIQEGQLDKDEHVVDVIPEFATNGKHEVRVADLFLHTAGFPMAPFRPLDWDEREKRIARFAQWRLNWPTRERYEYHPSSSMWVVAEIIERKTGQDFRTFIHERILDPLRLNDLFVGLPDSQNYRVATLEMVGDPLTSEDYARLNLPEPPETEVTPDAILSFNRPDIRAVGVPGGGALATAAALALFYQALLHGGANGGDRVWTRRTLEFGLKVISGDYKEQLTGVPVNRSLGVIISGDERRNFRGFGHTNSEKAFGHGGAGGQIAWADPRTGLSFAYVTNGHDRNPLRMGRRGVSLSTKAAALAT
ncbi:MAG: serine hydrolase [Gammaproteobacteria bacterium]|nr:serine hydrolase [Gammaproteobacteria bacterium]